MNWAELRAAWSRIFAPKPVPASPAPAPRPPDPPVAKAKAPRGIRNNNPGNIRGTGPAGQKLDPWRGQVGLDDQGFCIFDTPEQGLRALALLMLIYQSRHRLMTLQGIVKRWAPPNENNTAAYVAAVCIACGVRADDAVHLARDRHMLEQLVRAIVKHENGLQPYPPSVITAGVRMAMESAP